MKDKYRTMNSFHKYYSGEKVAPVTTIFIGGNHEASNHLKELYVFMVGETSGVKWCGVGGGRRVSVVFNPLSLFVVLFLLSLSCPFLFCRQHGGWVCPNIYYLGHSGVLNFGGLRIAGVSGIFKGYHFRKGYFEKLPYSDDDMRSVYHMRELEILKLSQVK